MIRRWAVFASIAVGALACQSVPAAKPSKPVIRVVPGWGEMVDLGEWPTDMFVRAQALFTNNDYPTRALREGQEGIVESWVVVAPNGRAAQVGIVRAPSKLIGEMTLGLLQRRFRVKFPQRPGKFVRVKLPPIQYRIGDNCDNNPRTPEIAGTVQVVGDAACPLIMVTPESWVTHTAEPAGQ